MSGDVRYEFRSLQYLLSDAQLETFLQLYDKPSRIAWIERFWEALDPTFTSEENELRAEHEQRVLHAEDYFRVPKWPGWDARGEMLIRYGIPTERYQHPAAVLPPPSGIVPAWEEWVYATPPISMKFEDVYASGEYTSFLSHVTAVGKPRGIYGGNRATGTRGGETTDGTDVNAGDRPLDSYGIGEWNSIFAFDPDNTENPVAYPFLFTEGQLPFYYTVDSFDGGKNLDRVNPLFRPGKNGFTRRHQSA